MALLVDGFVLQEDPAVYVAKIPGHWLLEHTTPSWRLEDPEAGFQRMVSERRGIEIARNVLDQGRTFPNAIVLATDKPKLARQGSQLAVPDSIRLLVVDGQHRLWAQTFSAVEAQYACVIHTGLDEPAMAALFIEINDTQKRVPASLRWDLVRLVRPGEDPHAERASDLVFSLNTDPTSALYQQIDLTGEVAALEIKQGSIAPEIKRVVGRDPLKSVGYDVQLKVLLDFLATLKDRDPNGWTKGTSNIYRNRVLRVLLRMVPEILAASGTDPEKATPKTFSSFVRKIDPATLDPAAIKGQQGSAGMTQILETLRAQVFQ